MNEQFIREVDEDYRLQRVQELWQRYRFWLIGGALALVCAAGGQSAWKSHMQSKAEADSATLLQAADLVREQKTEEAVAALDYFIAAHSGDPAADVAALWKARALYAAHKPEEAQKVFAALAADSKTDENVRSLAALYDISGAVGKEGGALAPLIKEREALTLLEKGKKEEARALLKTIMDDAAAPVTLRGRAALAMQAISAGETGEKR